MPLYKGNTKIGAIYKGTTPISAIYKGSTLIFSSYTWQEWYVEYIYNTLVPTTISSKNVLDKAKVSTIYGNSVVENQLVNTADTSITLGTHKYLTYINGLWSLITGTGQTISVSGGTDMVIDLNKMFPFNTPTNLTDIRVQAILNRGYIPYNTGTLKNVDMSEVSSESKSVCSNADFSITGYSMSATGEPLANANYNLTDFLPVKPNTTYKWHRTNNYGGVSTTVRLVEFSAMSTGSNVAYYNNEMTDVGENTITFTTTANTHYIRLSMRKTDTDVTVIHSFTPLSLKYQGSGVNTSHDTMVIDNDNVVFTKNMSRVDLGTLTWRVGTNGIMITSSLASLIKRFISYYGQLNLLCGLYVNTTSANIESGSPTSMSIAYGGNGVDICVYNPNYTDPEQFKTAMSGVMLEYQLATPQVITIPRKHIGVVDLGSLNWNSKTNGRIGTGEYFKTIIKRWSGYGTVPTMMCCAKYINVSPSNIEGNSPTNLSLSMSGNGFEVLIYDSELIGLTNAQIQAKLSGQYLYYETIDESTIPNIIGIQGGGTITTNSEVLPNIDFEVKAK